MKNSQSRSKMAEVTSSSTAHPSYSRLPKVFWNPTWLRTKVTRLVQAKSLCVAVSSTPQLKSTRRRKTSLVTRSNHVFGTSWQTFPRASYQNCSTTSTTCWGTSWSIRTSRLRLPMVARSISRKWVRRIIRSSFNLISTPSNETSRRSRRRRSSRSVGKTTMVCRTGHLWERLRARWWNR